MKGGIWRGVHDATTVDVVGRIVRCACCVNSRRSGVAGGDYCSGGRGHCCGGTGTQAIWSAGSDNARTKLRQRTHLMSCLAGMMSMHLRCTGNSRSTRSRLYNAWSSDLRRYVSLFTDRHGASMQFTHKGRRGSH